MPVTELITLTHPSIHAFLSLSPTYSAWCVRQSAVSAYPFTFYTDIQHPSTIYIVSGWHSTGEYRQWVRSDERRNLVAEIPITREVLLNMDFDTIPRAARGCVCVKAVVIRSGGEEDGDATWVFRQMEQSLEMRWTGCGEDVSSPSTLYRFTMYDQSVSCQGVLERNQAVGDVVVVMRRVALPS